MSRSRDLREWVEQELQPPGPASVDIDAALESINDKLGRRMSHLYALLAEVPAASLSDLAIKATALMELLPDQTERDLADQLAHALCEDVVRLLETRQPLRTKLAG